MPSSVQLNIPPMAVERLAKPLASRGETLAVDLCELVVAAFSRCGYSDKEAAGSLGIDFRVYSKAFGPNTPEHNPHMRRLGSAPIEVLREFFALGSAKVGLSVGLDHAKVQASVDFAEAAVRLLKVSER